MDLACSSVCLFHNWKKGVEKPELFRSDQFACFQLKVVGGSSKWLCANFADAKGGGNLTIY